VTLVLGDNIFYGAIPSSAPLRFQGRRPSSVISPDPERYGVVEFDAHGHAISIEEKPQQPKSNYAVPDFIFTTTTSSPPPRR